MQVVALLTEFHRRDLAVAEIRKLLMMQCLHEQVAVIIHRSKNGLQGGVSVLEIHERFIENKFGRKGSKIAITKYSTVKREISSVIQINLSINRKQYINLSK